ncbi:MAG: hypothetical protein HY791_17740 [Deltaproteobacteria bacterium]|nr:hypothetical protein [Deltaproteobacteria bacterium]
MSLLARPFFNHFVWTSARKACCVAALTTGACGGGDLGPGGDDAPGVETTDPTPGTELPGSIASPLERHRCELAVVNARSGSVVERHTTIFDQKWRLIRSESDRNADGVVDRIEEYEYDPADHLIRETLDVDADGAVEDWWQHFFEGDSRRYSDADLDDDPEPDLRRTYAYAGTTDSFEDDWDLDGSVDARVVERHDSNGNLLSWEEDVDADGAADSRVVQRHDELDRIVRQDADWNADEIIDRVETWDYAEAGDLSTTTWRVDVDGDGGIDVVTVHYVRSDGSIARSELDRDADGVVDLLTEYEMSCFDE